MNLGGNRSLLFSLNHQRTALGYQKPQQTKKHLYMGISSVFEGKNKRIGAFILSQALEKSDKAIFG